MTRTPKKDEKIVSIKNSSKHVTRGIVSNFLFNYGTLPINFLITFLFGKNIPQVWSIFIITFGYIRISRTIMMYLPPNIESVLAVRVPEFVMKDQYPVVKGIMRYIFVVKLIASTIMCLIYAGVGFSVYIAADTPVFTGVGVSTIFSGNYMISSGIGSSATTGIALMVLAPFIIFEELHKIFVSLFQGLKKFMIRFYLLLGQKVFLLISYLVVFYAFDFYEEIKLFIVLGLNVVVILPSLLVFVVLYWRKFKDYKTIPITWKNIVRTVKHGLNFTIVSSIQSLSNGIYIGILDASATSSEIVEYDMGNNLVSQSYNALNIPLTPILVDFHIKNKEKEMMRLFKKSTYFINILLALLTGFIFYIAEVYILVLYDPKYLAFVPLLKIYVLAIYFENWKSNYNSLYSSTRLERRMVYIRVTSFIISLLLGGGSYLIWGFPGLIIGLTLGRIALVLLYWIDSNFIIKRYKITLWNLLHHFVVLISIIILNYFLFLLIKEILPINWLVNILLRIINFLNININLEEQLTILINDGIQIVTFLGLYIVYVVFLRGITKQDLLTLENAKLKVPFKKVLRKVLRNKRENSFCVPI